MARWERRSSILDGRNQCQRRIHSESDGIPVKEVRSAFSSKPQRASICRRLYDATSFELFSADFRSSFVTSIHMGATEMTEETEERPDNAFPVNDNTNLGRDADIAPWEKIDRVVLSLARLIGRRIAREPFEGLQAANDYASSDKVARSEED